jgi:hypothetical protein
VLPIPDGLSSKTGTLTVSCSHVSRTNDGGHLESAHGTCAEQNDDGELTIENFELGVCVEQATWPFVLAQVLILFRPFASFVFSHRLSTFSTVSEQ